MTAIRIPIQLISKGQPRPTCILQGFFPKWQKLQKLIRLGTKTKMPNVFPILSFFLMTIFSIQYFVMLKKYSFLNSGVKPIGCSSIDLKVSLIFYFFSLKSHPHTMLSHVNPIITYIMLVTDMLKTPMISVIIRYPKITVFYGL